MAQVLLRPSAPSRDDVPVGAGRLGTAAAWISAVCCLPYLVLKVVWTFDVPLGIDDRSVLDESAWVVGNAVMAVIQFLGLLLVLALTRPWARRMPAWLVLFPAWVGTGLLFQVAVGAGLMALTSTSSADGGETDLGGIQPWVYVMVYSAFAGQGIALAIAFAYHVRQRWGWLLAHRTGDLAIRSEPRAGAALALVTAVVLVAGYWAMGGEAGLSGMHADDSWVMHASRAVGAVVAAAGLLGLAGGWAQRTRFWLPVGLTWIGSGAIAAFDGLNLAFNQLLGGIGDGASTVRWGMTESVLAAKVVVGLVAAAAGIRAVATAARNVTTRRERK